MDRITNPWLARLGTATVAGGLVACGHDRPDGPRELHDAGAGPTVVHASPKLTSIEVPNSDGGQERVACATCHTLKRVVRLPTSMGDLRDFHQGIRFSHGDLSCAHCHVAGERSHDSVHLANGDLIPMTEALRLCGQCHGRQRRDYAHGAHGGMQGAFAIGLGHRLQNHCVDCHDPHAPRLPAYQPVLPPRDRGTLDSLAGQGGHGGRTP
ncbi:MAG: hypothetical protein U0169_02240 [Polyangiaceae bacterium]